MENIKRINETSVEIDGKVYVRKEKTLQGVTEFEIGKWYVCGDNNVFRCDKLVNMKPLKGNKWAWSNDTEMDYISIYCRPATPAEIEAHLRKVCDEKYMGKRTTDLSSVGFDGGRRITEFYGYEYKTDKIWYHNENGTVIKLYDKGKWAEVLPDKKPLPKTREDFKGFIADYATTQGAASLQRFLDQYDFE